MTREQFRQHYRLARIDFRNILKKYPHCATDYHAHMIARIDLIEKYSKRRDTASLDVAACFLNRDRFEFSHTRKSGVTSTKQSNSIRWFRVLSLTLKGKFFGTFPKA